MNNYRKKFFYIFLFVFFVIGSITSLNVGISHDEYHEEENWKFNQTLSKDISNKIFFGKKSDFKKENYKDRYYGIGFQIISQPIQYFLKNLFVLLLAEKILHQS